MIKYLVKFLVNSPIYPHWLEYLKMRKGNEFILQNIKGDILEVGAGDGSLKKELISKNKDIARYIATDYSNWDGEFDEMNKKVKKYNSLGSIFFGYCKREPLDKVCSATELPFEKESFNHHLSFEVLEHINDPEKYFSEVSRILKPNGTAIMSVPFLYRMHGGEPEHKLDFFRYLNGFFYERAKKNDLEVMKIYNNTGFGTTLASLTNQWVIRRIIESNIIAKIIFFIFSPFIFLFTNITGFIIDIFPDKRFATRFHIILEKK